MDKANYLTIDTNKVILSITCATGYVAIIAGTATSTSNSATVDGTTVTSIIGCLSCGLGYSSCSLVA